MYVRLKPDPTYDSLRLSDRYMDIENALSGRYLEWFEGGFAAPMSVVDIMLVWGAPERAARP